MEFKNARESMVFSDQNVTRKVLFADENMLSFILNLKAGQSVPLHQHENATVVLNVLQGKGEIRINDEDERVEKDSILQASGQDHFGIPIVNEDMSVFVCISPNPENRIYSEETHVNVEVKH